ncbi:MAG: hypothetical protein UY92_C0008G0009 [Candidatus Magasanikbacteria bacterium GW2011_GWA2_56_11]|uniref:DUF4012 domain-containing protein n=1 Tax=Candidatus Magasanikbacteria bacterium GW2011_GWA2_56_11 TaxID=1619044 RepID=A0A0G1YFU6_9BACT|nr:MAG: hypothetical protein UY92_C0008G0009 [Candidatus Magasanikbacteria bacterium GW2011_GWA2_56_11]
MAVRVSPCLPVSPHVVDTGASQPASDWRAAVVPYAEPVGVVRRREIVDLAGLVSRANQEKSVAVKPPERKRIAVAVASSLARASAWRLAFAGRIRGFFGICQDNFQRGLTGRLDWRRWAASTAILLVAATLPFPAIGYVERIKADTQTIIEHSTNAFLSLQSSTVAALSTNIPQAEHDLNAALKSFGDAEELIDKEYRALVYVASLLPVVGKKVSSRQHLLTAGHHVALGNTYLVKGADEAVQSAAQPLVDRLALVRAHMRSAIPQYEAALNELSHVDSTALPVEYQDSFAEFKVLFSTFIDDMGDLAAVMSGLETMLGSTDFKRYLVVFQNHHELRPAGGFVGSFAVVDIQKGKLLNVEVPGGGSYDLQGQLNAFIKPPIPLQLVNYRWEFQDANWFPDFPSSAKKLAWFYQASRGTTVDGVIAVNASVLERVLKILGPVYSQDFDLLLNSDQALQNLQMQVESDYDKEKNQPKAAVAAILSQLIDSLGAVKPDEILGLVTELDEALAGKEIQVYAADEQVQREWREFGWTGEIAPVAPAQDYLLVVNTNVGGGKSDARMQQTVEHEALVQPNGSIIDTVIVRRRHEGDRAEVFYGQPNIDYLRLYVPAGAELIAAGGFTFPEEESFLVPEEWYQDDSDLAQLEVDEGIHVESGTRLTREFGKTVFGNWLVVEPGEEAEVWFTYRLPFSAFDASSQASPRSESPSWTAAGWRPGRAAASATSRYSLVVQKQSGSESVFSTQIIYPSGWQPVWRTSEDLALGRNGAALSAKLESDLAVGVVMEKK